MTTPSGYTALDFVGYTDKGDYSADSTYVTNDLVHYQNSIWRCILDDTTGITPAEGTNWTAFISTPSEAKNISYDSTSSGLSSANLQDAVDELNHKITGVGDNTQTINLIYPIGRTIICDHNPQEDYPWQTWVQDFMDQFPLGAGDTYAAGATGGEATHKLTVDEMPSHNHSLTFYMFDPAGGGTAEGVPYNAISTQRVGTNRAPVQSEGRDQPHNNMPPYKAVCYWTRTA